MTIEERVAILEGRSTFLDGRVAFLETELNKLRSIVGNGHAAGATAAEAAAKLEQPSA
jgi:hypothetical protein